jgi:hypothetical protein
MKMGILSDGAAASFPGTTVLGHLSEARGALDRHLRRAGPGGIGARDAPRDFSFSPFPVLSLSPFLA